MALADGLPIKRATSSTPSTLASTPPPDAKQKASAPTDARKSCAPRRAPSLSPAPGAEPGRGTAARTTLSTSSAASSRARREAAPARRTLNPRSSTATRRFRAAVARAVEDPGVLRSKGASEAGDADPAGPAALRGRRGAVQQLRRAMGAHAERCGRCTMEAAWRACDAFWEMDRRRAGQITRQEYFAALAEAETVAQLRLIRKARLDERFQRSAVPLSLSEFLQLLWPGASPEDAAAIRRWAQLREARKVLGSSSFRGAESELRRVFDRLDERGEGQVKARDIVRAQILDPEELRKLLKRDRCALDAVLDMDAFRTHVWPFLKARFITRETITKMKKEEEAMYDSAFRMGLGGTGSSS